MTVKKAIEILDWILNNKTKTEYLLGYIKASNYIYKNVHVIKTSFF